MDLVEELPIAVQTLYADLVHRAWTGNFASLISSGGSSYSREVRGRLYWYWQPPTDANGKRPGAIYLGPDNDQTRQRLRDMTSYADNLRQRRDMVRSLRAARLPTPDVMSGQILSAMAEAGIFRLRATVVGSVAFQSYPGLLGYHFPATLSRTGDLDIGQFESISIAVEDRIEENLEVILKKVDQRFEAIPDSTDGRRTMRYALRVGADEQFSVDILSPMVGPDRSKVGHLPALHTDAQLLRYLDFLLYQEVNSVVLYGPGIPINVPDPTRYALHKLIVAQLRNLNNPRSAAKARKDIDQAGALIEVLARYRPGDLQDIWQELLERGPSWGQKARASLRQLPPHIGELLGERDPEHGQGLSNGGPSTRR